MSNKKFTCPPQTASGQGTFSDNLVGFQLVQGGGLTQGNFEFVESANEKTNRSFSTGTFSDPINLDSLKIENIAQSKTIVENTFKVYPNFDLSQVSTFTLYGSMVKRISTSITNIINFFPAAIESNFIGLDISTGVTATNIVYDSLRNETKLDFNLSRIRNPFDIDFTFNSQRNLSLREIKVSELRDLTNQYLKYSLYYKGIGYELKGIEPTISLTNGVLTFYVQGNPFSGETLIYDNLVLRPNDYEVNKVFKENFDEVEKFILNRTIDPIYTAVFNVPTESNDGTYYVEKTALTWPLYGEWNLDILTESFEVYLEQLNQISEFFDLFRTNLISRFMTTGAFKEFDTVGQKMEKVLQIYGRSFDETQKFVSSLSFMTSVNYNVGDDIPSQLLKNLAQTLGWNTNISPITNDDLLSSVFGQKNLEKSVYEGVPISQTPDELNYQFYRNLILNSAYLFKSKGTRKSIEILLRLIGAPEALVEFNEYVYIADQKINLSQFEQQYIKISGGTYVQELPDLDPTNLFKIQGVEYTGFTTTTIVKAANITQEQYPIDEEGYPSSPEDTEEYFFQIGSGWFEQTPQHRAPEIVDVTNSVFTGQNPNFQTVLSPYTYGEVYLERFRDFPFMDLGFRLTKQIDNNKSWANYEVGLRSNLDSTFNALYQTSNDKLVLNVKNVDLFLNPAQGLVYDVWSMSKEFNYPIPNQGLNWVEPTKCNPNPNTPYPQRGGIDWTEINPQPSKRTFFEFAQIFWKNTINVRNRQFITDGKTGGYPTLQSIYWRYLESNETVNIPNDNFTYRTMIDYVNGLGDYWIRLVEQMVPATTIWNTGVKYENSIFHRQKFVWRRQRGCQLIPIPCKPCSLNTNLLNNDCPTQSIQCNITNYRTSQTSYNLVLTNLLNSYLISNSLDINDCQLNSIVSKWFIDIRIDDVVVYSQQFFTGYGYNDPNLSVPTPSNWYSALLVGLDALDSFGYGYYFINGNNTLVVYNQICSISEEDVNFKLNIGINFEISCN